MFEFELEQKEKEKPVFVSLVVESL